MNADRLKNAVAGILNAMGVTFDSIDELEATEEMVRLNIKTKESGILIGSKGESISALNHIIKKIAGKENEKLRISVDVNGYLEESNKALRNKIFILAERAKSFKTDVELDPMPPYERMLVHSFLSDDSHVETQSVGEGKNRRVVIKYKE